MGYWNWLIDGIFRLIHNRETHFMGHLKCFKCGEISNLAYELDALPRGWRVITRFISDPDGNPMVRHYAYCPKESDIDALQK